MYRYCKRCDARFKRAGRQLYCTETCRSAAKYVRKKERDLAPGSPHRCPCGQPRFRYNQTCSAECAHKYLGAPVWSAPEGSRFKRPNGYVMVKVRVGPNDWANVYEHRLVMQAKLGRPLRTGEEVHHLNGVKDDNRPENLELWSSSQPAGQRISDKLAWAREILALYGEEAAA